MCKQWLQAGFDSLDQRPDAATAPSGRSPEPPPEDTVDVPPVEELVRA